MLASFPFCGRANVSDAFASDIIMWGLWKRGLEVKIQPGADDIIRELGRRMSRCEP
jgi:hypothetical protein